MHGTRLLTVLVALGLIVGSVPGGAVGAAGAADAADVDSPDGAIERLDASTASTQTDGNATNDGNANDSDGDGASRATVGQQLATIIAVTDDEVSGDVTASSLDAALEDANESERAAVLAERSAALRERADEIVADQREARVAYEDGEITRGEFAQRLAVLAGQARTVDRGFERVAEGADGTSGIELRAAGYDRGANADARERLTRVTGTGASALLAQYTGERAGEFSLEVDGGVSIEVESDGGERSREIERDQPGDGSFNVTQSEALTAATAQLSTDDDGEWTLRSADRNEDDGYYEFEFTFFGPETTGEAEVSVDGQTGEAFEFEEELEPREQDGGDADETPLSISIANGTAEPGATVTLRVTAAGEPVEGATVELDDQDAGTTDADGRITVTLPDDEEVDIEVEDGDREGELEVTLRTGAGGDGDDDLGERLAVDGSVENETVEVSVTYDGEGVGGVSAYVDDELVGTTDADGTLSFDAPGVDDELEVTLEKGAFEAELEFEVGADGTLVAGDIDVDERDADDEDDDADGDDADGDDADDADDEDLSVAVVSGDPAPGATVTVEVTDADGEPVEGASVEVEGESVGTTDADGRIAVTLPTDDDEVEVEVEDGDREGELEIEFDADDEDEADADDTEDADDAEDADDEGDDNDDDRDDDDEDDDADDDRDDDDEDDDDDDDEEDE